jgi:oligopeptide/dipeptide ABC transporter ATP-binding protein
MKVGEIIAEPMYVHGIEPDRKAREERVRYLLSAVPVPDPEVEMRREHRVVQGEVPSPINPPSGCVFHPRCPLAVETCPQLVPALRKVRPRHWVACTEVERLPEFRP